MYFVEKHQELLRLLDPEGGREGEWPTEKEVLQGVQGTLAGDNPFLYVEVCFFLVLIKICLHIYIYIYTY